MQDVSRETLTFRNNANQTALPMRQLGSFLPGEGVGGAGVHWNGVTWRWLPWDHEPLKQTLASLRPKRHSARHAAAGLGRLLRRARALLRQVRISVWGLRQGRQSARTEDRRRQRVRGSAPARISQSADDSDPRGQRCSKRRRKASAITPSPDRPPTCRNPTSIPTASPSAPATIAAIASVSAVR